MTCRIYFALSSTTVLLLSIQTGFDSDRAIRYHCYALLMPLAYFSILSFEASTNYNDGLQLAPLSENLSRRRQSGRCGRIEQSFDVQYRFAQFRRPIIGR